MANPKNDFLASIGQLLIEAQLSESSPPPTTTAKLRVGGGSEAQSTKSDRHFDFKGKPGQVSSEAGKNE